MIDGTIPAAGFRHGDPGDNRVRRENHVVRQGKQQACKDAGGTRFRTVFEPDHQFPGNALMRTEGPGWKIWIRVGAFPGKKDTVMLQGFPAGGAKTVFVCHPAADAAEGILGPDNIFSPAGKGFFKRPPLAEQPGFKRTGTHCTSSRVSISRRARVV